MITSDQLKKLNVDAKWETPLNDAMNQFNIKTKKQIACFLGQALHESGNLHSLSENLHYSADRLHAILPIRISLDQAKLAVSKGVEEIAEAMYGNRADLGNNQLGDGFKFAGKGIFQLTGRANVTRFAQAVNKPEIIANPALLTTPEYACLSATWYWSTRNLNTLAESMNIDAISKAINGGTIGINERRSLTNLVMSIL
jgi:putative chitinase